MGNKTLDSVMNAIDAMKNRESQMTAAGKKKEMKEYRSGMAAWKRNYDAVSKYGDTLEISKDGKEAPGRDHLSIPGKKIISDAGGLT